MNVRDEATNYLTSDQREAFLAVLANMWTVSARAGYVEVGETPEHASRWLRCHNEVMHRLTNHLAALLRHGRSSYDDARFVDDLRSTAQAFGGCERTLSWAIEQSILVMDRQIQNQSRIDGMVGK